MSSKIRVLDELTINKIAAGEVIENPSSVVKELVENAIDAGATEITVEIKSGGRHLIRISDNGCGMSRDDALLCLERHATSKIQSIEDLHQMGTMGFRGEAVPSIASISKMTLLTCAEGQTEGTLVTIDGGQITHCGGAARSPGTTFEIKSLFFNVPVRKKFQRSPAYDISEILRITTIQALAHPQITFQLISNEKNLLSAYASKADSRSEQWRERIVDVLGQEYAAGLCPIESTSKDYSLMGFIGLPHYSRHNRTGQYLFINQRAVVSSAISFAMKDAYGTTLDAGRHPVFVLYLSMDGNLVDVNVHPQKREVRLRQELHLKEWIRKAVEEALQKTHKPLRPPLMPIYEPQEVRPAFSFQPRSSFSLAVSSPWEPTRIPLPSGLDEPKRSEPLLFSPELPAQEERKPALSKVIETFPGYVLLSSPNGTLELLDQQAAHACILHEKSIQMQQNGEGLPAQNLLIPHHLQLSPTDAEIFRAHLDALRPLGFEIQELERNHFFVHSVPQIIEKDAIEDVIQQIIQEMHQSQLGTFLEQEMRKKLCLAIGRVTVSKQRKITMVEAQSLHQQLMRCKQPRFCPNGKPTFVEISLQDLTSYFQK